MDVGALPELVAGTGRDRRGWNPETFAVRRVVACMAADLFFYLPARRSHPCGGHACRGTCWNACTAASTACAEHPADSLRMVGRGSSDGGSCAVLELLRRAHGRQYVGSESPAAATAACGNVDGAVAS